MQLIVEPLLFGQLMPYVSSTDIASRYLAEH